MNIGLLLLGGLIGAVVTTVAINGVRIWRYRRRGW